MKKNLQIISRGLVALAACVVCVGSQAASFTGFQFTSLVGDGTMQRGSDVVSMDPSDETAAVKALLNSYGISTPGSWDIAKVEVPESGSGSSASLDGLTVSWTTDKLSGTWNYSGPYEIYAYLIKGGNGLAYQAWALDSNIDEVVSLTKFTNGKEYNWTTEHLLNKGNQIPGLSHLVVYGPKTGVPEPGTLLASLAVAGLVFVGRRRLLA